MSGAAISDESAGAALFTRTNIAAFLAGGLAIGTAAYILGKQHSAAVGSARCNTKIATTAGEEKVKHIVEIEDIGDKKVFCRCWKSAKFPYCDQAHNKHNKETGDNVGPLVVKKGVAT